MVVRLWWVLVFRGCGERAAGVWTWTGMVESLGEGAHPWRRECEHCVGKTRSGGWCVFVREA